MVEVVNSEHKQVMGSTEISLNSLADQMVKKNKSYKIFNANQLNSGEIQLKLQWVHSKVKSCETMLQKYEAEIKFKEEDRRDMKQDLNSLMQPFPLLQLERMTGSEYVFQFDR